jgi:hypothetical protein
MRNRQSFCRFFFLHHYSWDLAIFSFAYKTVKSGFHPFYAKPQSLFTPNYALEIAFAMNECFYEGNPDLEALANSLIYGFSIDYAIPIA